MLARDQGEPLVAVARDRPAAADLDRVARLQAHHARPRSCAARRVGDAGIPYQHAYLQTILAHAGVPAELGQGGQRRRQPGAGDALRPGRRDPRRLLELRGDPAAPGRQAPERDPRRRRRRPRPTTSWCWSSRENEIANQTNELRRFVQALGRGYAGGARRSRGRRRTRSSSANPRLDRQAPAGQRQRHAAGVLPRHGEPAVGLAGPDAQWNAYGQWMLAPPPDHQSGRGRRRLDQPAAGRPGAVDGWSCAVTSAGVLAVGPGLARVAVRPARPRVGQRALRRGGAARRGGAGRRAARRRAWRAGTSSPARNPETGAARSRSWRWARRPTLGLWSRGPDAPGHPEPVRGAAGDHARPAAATSGCDLDGASRRRRRGRSRRS